MTLTEDGALLVLARACLGEIYEQCLYDGFHGRCNGSRGENPSPIPGSNIILGSFGEIVVVYQTEKGRGPLAVVSYFREPGSEGTLGRKVRDLLKAADLL